MTFTDSANGGEWENTKSGSEAVNVNSGASATFTGGSYKGKTGVSVEGTAKITGGTFTGTNMYAIVNSGRLTVEGGVFRATYCVCSGSDSQLTTITGGDFSGRTNQSISYWGGILDLSSYPTTATTGTTALTNLTLINFKASTAVGTDIKLPEGYGFYELHDTAQTIVTSLAEDGKNAIKLADIVSVNITWTAMEFTYTDGAWNPATHTYADGTWSTSGGTVTVKNTGNVGVTARFAYTTTRTDIIGSFTKWNFTLVEGRSDSTQLTLTGKPSASLDHESLGSITVTIAKAGE